MTFQNYILIIFNKYESLFESYRKKFLSRLKDYVYDWLVGRIIDVLSITSMYWDM